MKSENLYNATTLGGLEKAEFRVIDPICRQTGIDEKKGNWVSIWSVCISHVYAILSVAFYKEYGRLSVFFIVNLYFLELLGPVKSDQFNFCRILFALPIRF